MGWKFDTSGLRRMHSRIHAIRPGARMRAAKTFGGELITALVFNSPTDTNRYLRGWVDAGRQAGVTSRSLPQIVPSRSREKMIKIFERQLKQALQTLKYWEDRKAVWYDNKPKRDRDAFYPKILALIRKSKKRADRAAEELAKLLAAPEAVVINLYRSGGKLATVRDKVYGGYGALRNRDGQVALQLTNKEAHSKIVEKREQVLKRSEKATQVGAAFKRAGREYMRELKKAAG